MREAPVITTPRLRLRPHRMDDMEALALEEAIKNSWKQAWDKAAEEEALKS